MESNKLYPKGHFLEQLTTAKPEFDQNKYSGRLKQYLMRNNPFNMLLSPKKIREAKEFVDNYDSGRINPETVQDKELYRARRIVNSVYHKPTGKKIYYPFRMSSFIPFNVTLTSLLMTAKTVPGIVFWQTMRQTFVTCVTLSNKGSAKKVPNSIVFRNYCLATAPAVGSAVSLNLWIKRTNYFQPRTKTAMLAIVPWFAVILANIVDVCVNRSTELVDGTTVFDKNMKLIGYSKIAGRKAITLTLLSRFAFLSGSMMTTPFITTALWKNPSQAQHLFITACMMLLTLPPSVAFFKNLQKIKKTSLEKEFHEMDLPDDDEYIYFNKGVY